MLRICDSSQGHVVAGQFTAGVESDSLAQRELDPPEIRAQFPALCQARLGCALRVVGGEVVVRQVYRDDGAGTDEVRIEIGWIAKYADAQRAARFDLSGSGGPRGRRRGC